MNRITKAVDGTEHYNLDLVYYDKNGNITSLKRKGHTNAGASIFGVMDALTYTYDGGNKLFKVSDSGYKEGGFIDGSNTGNDYVYDANGNMIKDAQQKALPILHTTI